ncbi:MAG: 30S ribosomal protein S7 [Candidatus Shikimatogenerans bostrichidophilus]|nr:MAG: 30S ribosomal protein S7 [Candidatus Shikimatogenerans bostrichidophilus]
MRKKNKIINKYKNKNIYTDYKYNDKIIDIFINYLMKNGKKYLAYKIFYKTLKVIENKYKKKKKKILPLNIFKKSLKNISPKIEIKNRKIGGTTYNIPIKIGEKKKQYLAIKWLIFFSKKRKEYGMFNKLANEIISAYNGIGNSIKKKNEIHKIAESNKAFSHFKF